MFFYKVLFVFMFLNMNLNVFHFVLCENIEKYRIKLNNTTKIINKKRLTYPIWQKCSRKRFGISLTLKIKENRKF